MPVTTDVGSRFARPDTAPMRSAPPVTSPRREPIASRICGEAVGRDPSCRRAPCTFDGVNELPPADRSSRVETTNVALKNSTSAPTNSWYFTAPMRGARDEEVVERAAERLRAARRRARTGRRGRRTSGAASGLQSTPETRRVSPPTAAIARTSTAVVQVRRRFAEPLRVGGGERHLADRAARDAEEAAQRVARRCGSATATNPSLVSIVVVLGVLRDDCVEVDVRRRRRFALEVHVVLGQADARPRRR